MVLLYISRYTIIFIPKVSHQMEIQFSFISCMQEFFNIREIHKRAWHHTELKRKRYIERTKVIGKKIIV